MVQATQLLTEAPVEGAAVPGRHAVQLAETAATWYAPAEQTEHALAPTAE